MAGNTKCYRVTVKPDGTLNAEVVDFSPRYADKLSVALHRLQNVGVLDPPLVKFSDWPELERRWAEQAQEVKP
jgi:hypothetical protein